MATPVPTRRRGRLRARWGGVVASWVAVACTQPAPQPRPSAVDPAWAFSGEDTRVDILGTDFWPTLEVRAARSDRSQVDDAFQVVLRGPDDAPDGYALEGVRLVDLGRLAAVVPAGLPAGRYDVDVVAPGGALGTGADLFTVGDTRAEALRLTFDRVSYTTFETADLAVQVVDPFGDPVEGSLPVEVVVEADDGTVVGRFGETSLAEQEALPDGLGIRGRLGVDGSARIELTVETPDVVTLAVRATDGGALAGDDARLVWNAGDERSLRILLPEDPMVARAGEGFTATVEIVDQFGAIVPDGRADVVIRTACNSWVDRVEVVDGREAFVVEPRFATGTTSCPLDRLIAFGGELGGESETFEVEPGDPVRFDVLASPPVLRAGGQVTLLVQPVDAWGNDAPWAGAVETLDDGLDGVLAATCSRAAPFVCTAQLVRAAPALTLDVVGSDGLTGSSGVLEVRPGVPTVLQVTPGATTWTAGEPVSLQLSAVDAWGNDATDALLDPATAVVEDPRDQVVCTPDAPAGATTSLACTLTTATPATAVSVTFPDAEPDPAIVAQASGTSAPFAVVNGPLATVAVAPSTTAVEAGRAFAVQLDGRDAYGNPYRVQSDAVVDLGDAGGTLSPQDATLGPDGTREVLAVLTLAGTTRIDVSQAGAPLGLSAPIEVSPSVADRLAVEVRAPWTWVDARTEIRLEAVDPWGNRDTTRTDTVTLESVSGVTDGAVVDLINGTATADLVWRTTGATEVVEAVSDQGLVGVSEPVIVADDCEDGPSVDVRFGGSDFGRACLDALTGVARVQASFSASQPTPGASFIAYGVAVDGGPAVSGTTTTLQLRFDEVGIFDGRALAVQSGGGCGDEVPVRWYIGPDDGTATGPVGLYPDAPSVDLLGTAPQVDVEIRGVTDCLGAPAAGARLRVRTDRGALTGASATGEGLEVVLDTLGGAQLTLDASAATTGGTAQLDAWAADGNASGGTTVVLLGDRQPPTVWSQVPRGDVSDPVDTITLRVDEALDPATVDASAFSLAPADAVVVDAALVGGGRTVDLTLDTPLDPAVGGWVLTADASLTDLAGNALAGRWAAAGVPYQGPFGSGGTVDPVLSCSRSTETITPDGDDGPGAEADRVVFSFQSATAPRWWVISVLGVDGEAVRRTWQVPTGPTGSWTWDGRDRTGRRVPAGTYTLLVDAEGDLGNLGGACTRAVDVRVEAVP